MILNGKSVLQIFFIFLYFINTVLSECLIKYDNNPLKKPQFSKKIGSRKISISNSDNVMTMQDHEEVIAHCDIRYERPSEFESKSDIILKCDNSYLQIYSKRGDLYGYGGEVYLECATLKWNLYEMSQLYHWCPSNTLSYALARPRETIFYSNLAGICFDTDNMILGSLYYTMGSKPHTNLLPYAFAKFNNIRREEIKYIQETFTKKSITPDTYDNQQFKNWTRFANYSYDSIIQNLKLRTDIYNEFGSLLDFPWWPNLRLGNWRLYEAALAGHVEKENADFDILAGISGVVMAPIKDTCQDNYTMKELVDNTNQKIPLYVWNYLQARNVSNSNDDIVIIGFNSPFYEFYSKSDVIFCPDMCREIDWLKNVRSTFSHSTMGVIFCCKVEDVKASKRLDGFPENINEPQTTTNISPTHLPFVYEQSTVATIEEEVDAVNVVDEDEDY